MQRIPFLSALLALGLATACGGSGNSGSTGPGGTVQAESEGNDTPGSPQSLGTLAPGESLSVRGAVSAFSADQFDSYRFTATQATMVEFELEAEGSTADLDVWLTNATGEVQQRFEIGGPAPETGDFALAASEVALLVVSAADVDSEYLLTISGL